MIIIIKKYLSDQSILFFVIQHLKVIIENESNRALIFLSNKMFVSNNP